MPCRRELKSFWYLKSKLKPTPPTQRNAFIMDLSKILLGLNICRVLKHSNPPVLQPWYVEFKQKDNGIDETTLQCCYGHYKRSWEKQKHWYYISWSIWSVWYTLSQFIICQTKYVWFFFQCDENFSNLFDGTISECKYR